MKEISISIWELKKEEVKNLPENTQVLVYNPMTGTYLIEYADKKCLANYKYASSYLKYFTFDNPKDKTRGQTCVINKD